MDKNRTYNYYLIVLVSIVCLLTGCSASNNLLPKKPWVLNYQVEDQIWDPHLGRIKRSWNEANQELLQIFPLPTCPGPRLFLVSNQQFNSILNSNLKPNGFYAKESIFLNYSITNSPNQISRTLKHELTHAYLDCLASGKTPVWFDEGLAQFMEGHYSEAEKSRDQRLVQRVPELKISELENSFSLLSKDRAIIAYKQSKLMFAYLLKVTNTGRLRIYLKLLKSKEPEAFQRAFALSLKDFYVNSSRYARHN